MVGERFPFFFSFLFDSLFAVFFCVCDHVYMRLMCSMWMCVCVSALS